MRGAKKKLRVTRKIVDGASGKSIPVQEIIEVAVRPGWKVNNHMNQRKHTHMSLLFTPSPISSVIDRFVLSQVSMSIEVIPSHSCRSTFLILISIVYVITFLELHSALIVVTAQAAPLQSKCVMLMMPDTERDSHHL
jgi:hypothetical protein